MPLCVEKMRPVFHTAYKYIHRDPKHMDSSSVIATVAASAKKKESAAVPISDTTAPPSPDSTPVTDVDAPSVVEEAPSPAVLAPETPAPLTPTQQAEEDLAAIRSGFSKLAESQCMDKAAALKITAVPAMELLAEQGERVRDMAALRNELEQTRLQNELDRLARRHTLDEVQIQQLSEHHHRHSSSSSSLRGSVRR